MGQEVTGLRSTNWQSQNSHGDVKYSIGNGIGNLYAGPMDMNKGEGID